MLHNIRNRLTYANVAATIAVFVALGGTSYALTLPRDSIGSRELRSRSVGAAELKTGAVTSRDLRDRSIRVRDLSLATRESLRGARGPTGPNGVNFFVAVNSAGARIRGNATRSSASGANERVIYFPRNVDACAFSASPARVGGGLIEDPPPGSTVTVADNGDGGVLVRTWDASHAPTPLPFHLIVAC